MMKKKKAFTMIEMMIVVAVIGFLLTLIGPRVIGLLKKGEISATRSTMAALKSAITEYRRDMGHFPTKKDGGLKALIVKPNIPGNENWDGPYLEGTKEIPLDKWGNEFEYNCPPVKYKDKYRYYEIISEGPQGEDKPLDMGA